MNYDEYLLTDHWKETRTKVRRRARGWCERCKVRERRDIHHLNYDRLGREQPGDLVAVCRPCHEYLHGKRRVDPASIEYTPKEVKIIRYVKKIISLGFFDLEVFLARRPEYIAAYKKYCDDGRRLDA